MLATLITKLTQKKPYKTYAKLPTEPYYLFKRKQQFTVQPQLLKNSHIWKVTQSNSFIITAHGDCSHEIKRCLFLGRNLDSILKCRENTLLIKVHLVKAMVFSVAIYGCETSTIKKAECQRIDVFELWCWRRLLRVPWTARRSNQSILKEMSLE